ncbi:hypothetical protein GQ457_17G008180 [Hibiscus cannabinus]
MVSVGRLSCAWATRAVGGDFWPPCGQPPTNRPEPSQSRTGLPSKTRPKPSPYGLIEGSVDRRDRPSAQPSSFLSTQPRESVITEDSCSFSPDQTGNPLRPKASPWVGSSA